MSIKDRIIAAFNAELVECANKAMRQAIECFEIACIAFFYGDLRTAKEQWTLAAEMFAVCFGLRLMEV